MKKIIIAIDYNPSSQKVAETGYSLAKKMDAEVVIVHVISDAAYYAMPYAPIMGYEGFMASNTALLAEDLKTEAGNYLKATAKHLGDDSIETVILEGSVAETILSFAEKKEADLLVMGSHSHSGLYKLLIGDVAAKVLQHATMPMLIIPNKETKPEEKN